MAFMGLITHEGRATANRLLLRHVISGGGQQGGQVREAGGTWHYPFPLLNLRLLYHQIEGMSRAGPLLGQHCRWISS